LHKVLLRLKVLVEIADDLQRLLDHVLAQLLIAQEAKQLIDVLVGWCVVSFRNVSRPEDERASGTSFFWGGVPASMASTEYRSVETPSMVSLQLRLGREQSRATVHEVRSGERTRAGKSRACPWTPGRGANTRSQARPA
jgi:hypothetical protein